MSSVQSMARACTEACLHRSIIAARKQVCLDPRALWSVQVSQGLVDKLGEDNPITHELNFVSGGQDLVVAAWNLQLVFPIMVTGRASRVLTELGLSVRRARGALWAAKSSKSLCDSGETSR